MRKSGTFHIVRENRLSLDALNFLYHLLIACMLAVLVFCKELTNLYNIFSFEVVG